MLDLVFVTWLLALATTTTLFVAVVLFQALTRRVRAAVQAQQAAGERAVPGPTSPTPAAAQAA